MGARGPAKTPTAILKARDSHEGKYRRKDEPDVKSGTPVAPKRLTGRVKKEWDKHCELLEAAGILSEVDGGALLRYCRAWAKWLDLADIDESKIVIETADDLEKVGKHVEKMMRLSEHLLRFEIQYGMTPSSRANVKRIDKPAHGNSKDKNRFIDMKSVRNA